MNYIKITSLLLIFVLFASCEQDFEDDRFSPRDRTTGWVEFADDTLKTFPSYGAHVIPFDVQVPINDGGLVLDYTAESVFGTPPDSFNSGDFTSLVPQDTRNTFDTLMIPATPNQEYTIKYSLNNVDDEDVTVGIENSGRFTEHVVRVCPVPLEWTGENLVTGEIFSLTLTPTDDPRVFETQTAWGTVGQDNVPYPATFELNREQELTITSSNSQLTGGSGQMQTCDGKADYVLQQELFVDDPNAEEPEFLEFEIELTVND